MPRMESASFKELACSGALDEISNSENGEAIERYIRGKGLVREGKTCRAVLFVIYQTTRFGPQNGFRLALILEGVTPENVREQLKGAVEQDAAEYVVVKP